MSTLDFTVTGGGSIYLLRPLTDAARAWVDDHIPDTAMWLGRAVAIEHRYLWPIVEGIDEAGLTLEI
jgi:hypothetical protein